MAKFYNVTLHEMENLFRPDKGWTKSVQGREVLFNFPLRSVPNVEIKVYSGILAANGQSRACGGDAIRVAAVDVRNNRGWIASKRVHRVTGWEANLKARVLKVIEQSKARARG